MNVVLQNLTMLLPDQDASSVLVQYQQQRKRLRPKRKQWDIHYQKESTGNNSNESNDEKPIKTVILHFILSLHNTFSLSSHKTSDNCEIDLFH